MRVPSLPIEAWGVIAVVGALVALSLYRAAGGNVSAIGQAVGGAAVDAAGGAVSGVATGIGDAIGVPRTDQTACQLALAEGRYWDASFACPAGTFLKGAWRGATGSPNVTD